MSRRRRDDVNAAITAYGIGALIGGLGAVVFALVNR